jgi:hypothetical protein
VKTTTNAGTRRRATDGKRIIVTVPRGAVPRTTVPTVARPPTPSTPAASPANGIDVCSALFEICKDAQSRHLDPLGAACMFDVDGGRAPSWVLEALRSVIEMTIADIARTSEKLAGGAVGITLRQSGGFWALAIAENLSGTKGAARGTRRLAMVRALTDRIDCICRALPNPNGSTIAVAFPAGEQALPSPRTGRVLH